MRTYTALWRKLPLARARLPTYYFRLPSALRVCMRSIRLDKISPATFLERQFYCVNTSAYLHCLKQFAHHRVIVLTGRTPSAVKFNDEK